MSQNESERPRVTVYPKKLLEEMDEDTLKKWRQRMKQRIERHQFELEKVEAELEERDAL